jgi:hypothetical protein
MPQKAGEVLRILGAEGSGLVWGALRSGTKLPTFPPLFPRIEIEKKA